MALVVKTCHFQKMQLLTSVQVLSPLTLARPCNGSWWRRTKALQKGDGKVERLKEAVRRKSEEVSNLSQQTVALAAKVSTTNKALKR